MTEVRERRGGRDHVFGLIALAVPIALLVWQSTLRYGWLEMATSRAVIFWPAALVWLISLIFALRRRQWWALLSAPLALYPIVGFGLFVYGCSRGDCL